MAGQIGPKRLVRFERNGWSDSTEIRNSNHDHQLILVVDDIERGREVSDAWARETQASADAAG